MTIGVAQNWSAEAGGLSAMNGPKIHGRSSAMADGFSKLTEDSSLYGYNFQEQWARALQVDPDMVFITGWNEWVMGRFETWQGMGNAFPDQFDKLKAEPSLIPNMVSEIIRWQTPLAHMRRTAKEDVVLGGQQIKAGDRVVMWYVSGNRDESVFENADDFVIDRPNARKHIAFGFGLHRCMGNRVAEMQLRIAWDEILKRFSDIQVVGEPVRVKSGFVKGYSELPVRLTAV